MTITVTPLRIQVRLNYKQACCLISNKQEHTNIRPVVKLVPLVSFVAFLWYIVAGGDFVMSSTVRGIRLDEDLYERVRLVSEAERRTIANAIVWLVEIGLKEYESRGSRE